VSPSKAPKGDAATVYGFSFCPTTSCDPVSILVDDDPVLDDVTVNDEGAFQADFNVGQALGKHTAKATQKTNDGQTLEDTYQFEVISGTRPPVSGAPTPGGGTPTPAPGETGGSTASPSGPPGENGSETPSSSEESPGSSPRPGETGRGPSPTRTGSGEEPDGDDDDSTAPWVVVAVALAAAALAGGAFAVLRRRRR